MRRLLFTSALAAVAALAGSACQTNDAPEPSQRPNMAPSPVLPAQPSAAYPMAPARPTADDQTALPGDMTKLAAIRQAVVKAPELSTDAQNVKIIVEGGHVTLRGPVHTAVEKMFIEYQAQLAAGASNVTSQLTVAP